MRNAVLAIAVAAALIPAAASAQTAPVPPEPPVGATRWFFEYRPAIIIAGAVTGAMVTNALTGGAAAAPMMYGALQGSVPAMWNGINIVSPLYTLAGAVGGGYAAAWLTKP
jgi:hypothetical protein